MSFTICKRSRTGKWIAMALLGMAMACLAHAQAVTTTTVQGTVYLASGLPASGTLQLSWPAFTTAAGQAIAADRTTVTIGLDGFLSVNLAPNLGASPAGLYYTAVYNLSDGSTSTEYWVVPAASTATIAQIRAQVMPAAQAVQTASISYVDQAVQAVAQSSLTTTGGALSGPLYLSSDPTQPMQAADKHYVDIGLSQAGSGTVNGGNAGQVAFYNGSGNAVSGINAVPIASGGTGATTATAALSSLGGASLAATAAQAFAGPLEAPSLTASVNKTLLVTAAPYNAYCDVNYLYGWVLTMTAGSAVTSGMTFTAADVGKTISANLGSYAYSATILSVTGGNATMSAAPTQSFTVTGTAASYGHNDQTAIQNAFNDALTNSESVEFPAGRCLTGTITWKGQNFFGHGVTITTVQGMPGQDVFQVPDGTLATALPINTRVHDLTINVDTSLDASATAAGGNNTFPNRIFGTAGGLTPLANPILPTGIEFGPAYNLSGCTGAITTGTTTFTLPCGHFDRVPTPMLIGAPITVQGAGAGGANLVTTISALISSTQVTLAAAASTTVTAASGNFLAPLTPPWYCGNAAIAAPGSDGSLVTQAVDGWTFDNVTIADANVVQLAEHHSCGMFLQRNLYALNLNNVTISSLFGGYIEALPATNVGYVTWTPDTSIYKNLNFNYDMLPLVTYNGGGRVYNSVNIYGGTGNLMPTFGPFFLTAPTGFSSGLAAYTGTATVSNFYYDAYGYVSGENQRYMGNFNIVGGALANANSTAQITEWLANDSVVDTSILDMLKIDGNQNVFRHTQLMAGSVIDNGYDNTVETGVNASDASQQRRWYNNPTPTQEPVGKLDGGFVLSGSSASPFVSGSDLVTTCRDYAISTASGSAVPCLNDPTGTEISKSYMHASGATNPYSGYTLSHMAAGVRFPLGKLYAVTQGRCVGATGACTSNFLLRDATTSTTIASCNMTYGSTWTMQGSPSNSNTCLADLSSVPYGDMIGWQFNNFSGTPTAVDVAMVAFQPYNADTIAQTVTSPLFKGYLSATGGAPVTLTAANWQFNGNTPGVLDTASPVGYSTSIGNAWSNSAFNGDTNLNGGHLFPAVNGTLSVLIQGAPVITDTLAVAQASTDTTLTITTATTSAWPSSGCLLVGQEIECYSGSPAVGTTVLTVTRGQHSTTAQAHSLGATYYSVGTGTLWATCNSANQGFIDLVFQPGWTWYTGTFAGQNCSGYASKFSFNTGGFTGQVYKVAAFSIAAQPAITAATASGQVPVSSGAANVFPYNTAKALAGSGTGITTGPTSSTAGDLVTFSGTTGQIQDSGKLLTAITPLTGTTGSIGGSALTAGTCTSGTATVTGATTSMAVIATPATYPGDGADWLPYVSAAGTVTVKVCNSTTGSLTPTASTYNVRVIP